MKKITAKVKKLPVEKIPISTPFIKLDSFLKLSGAVMTGGEAKAVVLDGCVRVNGEPCLARGKKLHPGDSVRFSGRIYEVIAEE